MGSWEGCRPARWQHMTVESNWCKVSCSRHHSCPSPATRIGYNIAIKACQKQKDVVRACEILKEIQNLGLHLLCRDIMNEYGWTDMCEFVDLGSALHPQARERATSIMRVVSATKTCCHLRNEKLLPDIVSYTSAMRVCSSCAQWTTAMLLFSAPQWLFDYLLFGKKGQRPRVYSARDFFKL